MSRFLKLALVIAVIAIGAKQLVSPSGTDLANASSVAGARISPEEITRAADVLPETKITSYEWVYLLP